MTDHDRRLTRRTVLKYGGSAALAAGLAGCSSSGGSTGTTTTQSPTTSTTNDESSKPMVQLQTIQLAVMGGARRGPKGHLHDTFAPGSFTLTKGVPAVIKVYNYGEGRHSLTAPKLDLDVDVLPSAKKGVPDITTAMLTPTETGNFTWKCEVPCDGKWNGWAMEHDGYMKGTINVTSDRSTQHIYTTVNGGYKAGPKGNLHDTFMPANFTVTKGTQVKLHVENFDAGAHSFTAPKLNTDVHIPPRKKEGKPSETVVSFTPKNEGTYHWECTVPCDKEYNGWAMKHDGYMAGEVNVV